MVRDKPGRERLLGRPARKWEDNIRMNLKGIGVNTKNLVDSAQDRGYWKVFVNTALDLQIP